MFFLIALFLISDLDLIQGQDSVSAFVYSIDDSPNIQEFGDLKFLRDSEEQYEAFDILQMPESKFLSYSDYNDSKTSITVWSRIKLLNGGARLRSDFFSFSHFADSIWVYKIHTSGKVDTSLTGMALYPNDKSLLSVYNYYPFSLSPGETADFVFKLKYPESVPDKDFANFSILSGPLLKEQNFHNTAWHYFSFGIMLLFCLLGIFTFFIFRDHIFIYFSLAMFFFAFYFPFAARINIVNIQSKYYYPIVFVAVAGIVLSFFLFENKYLRLSKFAPIFFRTFLFYTVFVFFLNLYFAFSLIFEMQLPNESIADYAMIPFMLLGVISAFPLIKKNDKSARIYLFSIGILCASAVAFVLDLTGALSLGYWTGYSFQIGVMLFSGLLFYGLFNRINLIRGEKERFRELDELKSHFFANISHEFRTPLTLVMGPLKQLLEQENNAANQNLLSLAYRNGKRLLQLINQLLDLSKLESGKMELKVEEQDFTALLKGIVMSFESIAKGKNINLHFISEQESFSLFYDRDKVEKIFYNLLSNAFKFTDEGEVTVMIVDKDDFISVIVKDTGIGIPAQRLSNIFNRFYQVDNTETREQEGTGIGLALVKELVHLHAGRINVQSRVGKGSSFILNFPKGKDHFDASVIFEKQPFLKVDPPNRVKVQFEDYAIGPDEVLDNSDVISGSNKPDQPLVLIVEDNADVRVYIRLHLLKSFRIIEAANGQEGIDRALEHLPDLIISDVMMPKKNGIELCYFLKNDQRTSHIPLILLTAKASHEDKLKGLETKADDYLVKPFDTKELEVRVLNLIKLRDQLRKRYSKTTTFVPDEFSTNEVDNRFLKSVGRCIESNLQNAQFGVDSLSEEVNMSRGHLNRKLKALTGLSANKFIQSFRLQKALKLLQTNSGNVSEIAYSTGFGSVAYFVKCFREKFGQTPGSLL